MAVYWITGLSGAGKSTIGHNYYQRLLSKGKNVVFLDGDELRLVMGGEDGYDQDTRKNLAFRYSRLCKLLSDQGLNVVIATISMFYDIQDWNRKNIQNYVEIYIKVPLDVLIKRDQKNLYSSNQKNVAGFSSQYEVPKNPDVVLINDGSEQLYIVTDQLELSLEKADLSI
jgi:adenylylsulfate kinase-like enzyme